MKLVVKVGGSLIKRAPPDAVLDDVARLARKNRLIMVHGGGDLVTSVAEKLGKKQMFIVSPSGVRSRFTDKETAEIYTMVMSGMVSARMTEGLAKRGVNAVSLSGLDGSLFVAKRKEKLVTIDGRGRKIMLDGGYTGKIEKVNSDLVERLLEGGYVPVISPIAMSKEGESLNVDGDRAASSTAIAIRANAVVFLTNVTGLMKGEELVERASVAQARALLPSIGFGMQKKLLASAESVEGGVREAIICSGAVVDPVTRGLNHQNCTVIS